jgi:DNA invertase Pin-like site-specific DNA recombinase
MSSAAIYARVSSVRQKKDETIGSQTAALRAHAEQLGLDVPDDWVFEDEGHSGATLVRPALERLRDLVAGVGIDVVLCYSPDRLARKFAYQALLIEEFTRAGTRVEFIKGPRGDSPEDQLLVQFQGMFAEYEKAQIMERYRRGKTHRAKTGSINVLSGAPFGYRYLRKNTHTGAAYEIVEHEAALVVELFRRYADDGASIAELARWLSGSGVPTRTGKHRWDRSVIWGMLHNPAYAGRAVFGKTMIVHESPALNRIRPAARPIHPAGVQDGRPATIGVDRDPGAGHRQRGHLRPSRAAAGRQQALRLPQQPQPLAAARPGRLRGLWVRLLPRLDPHHQQEDPLLPVPGQRRLPLRGRAGLRQQAGTRRLPRHRGLGPHHRPADPTPADPRRDQQTPGHRAQQRPRRA